MNEINPNSIYTTEETREILRVSQSTIKRMLKNGMIRANKIGRQYRIMGKEIIRVVSPEAKEKSVHLYQRIKRTVKSKIKSW